MSHTETPNTTPNATTFGLQLRQHREQKGLSIGEVSERLKLPARQIEALEKGDYELLPEPVFIRGFLRSYGRFLDMPEADLNAYLTHFSPPTKTHRVSSSSTTQQYSERKAPKPFPTWIFGVLAAIGIGYGVYAWQNKSQIEHAKQEAENSIMPASSPINASSASNFNNGNFIVKPMENIAASTSQSQVQAASESNIAGELIVQTRYRTMLTITNAKGEVLMNQIVPARSEHRFADGAPFEVRLGYAIGSNVRFDGKEINLDEVRKGGKTAVFTAGDVNTPMKKNASDIQ
ncbi:MAG: DUF4115 domain-containing protein [Alysiella sp.]|uniref:helix-turn-helix domain-containing protein n=1 Tax=Alysiella sp. TaxID=1872483 RepID=UPI0026DB419E|nr:helix-turn-helix domain-containing protein [Alysiella sp.]MDO4434242.1 DUF4115 domain-containing protein [Alysiella sp.]